MNTENTAKRMLRTLSESGVERIYGIVGREANSITFDEVPDLDFVLTRHEADAGFMAIAEARYTGRPQVCFATIGPGSTNLVTAMATAMVDRYPLICISAQLETYEVAYNNAHQCVDGASICRPVAKLSYELNPADDIAAVLEQSLRIATSAPAGPVFLSIPNDILKAQAVTDGTSGALTMLPAPEASAPRELDRETIAAIAQVIDASSQPLIVVGDAALRHGAAAQIAALAHGHGIPVVSSYAATGAMPSDDALYYGPITPHIDSFIEYPALDEVFGPADAILLVGYDVAEHILPWVWTRGAAKKVIRLAEFPNPTPERVPTDLDLVVPDLSEAVSALDGMVGTRKEPHDVSGLVEHMRRIAEDQTSPEEGLRPEQVVCSVNQFLGDDYILCNDVGFHRHMSALFFSARNPLDFMTTAGLSSFGTGLPFGIGAKLARPDREVVVVSGDTGFHSSGAELETAVRLGLKLTVIVLQNAKSGLIERYQQMGHGRVNPDVLEYRPVDFARLAEANGAQGLHADSLEKLADALKLAADYQGVTLIEIPVSYPDNYLNDFTVDPHKADDSVAAAKHPEA
jgi:N2-(2-carboxyethyl)arginine synthase